MAQAMPASTLVFFLRHRFSASCGFLCRFGSGVADTLTARVCPGVKVAVLCRSRTIGSDADSEPDIRACDWGVDFRQPFVIAMLRKPLLTHALVACLTAGLTGCSLNKADVCTFYDSAKCAEGCGDGPAQLVAEEPILGCGYEAAGCGSDIDACELEAMYQAPPTSFDPSAPINYQDLSLEEAIAYALEHAKVLRDLGATLIDSPDAQATVYNPALAFSNPLFGEEAALSAFDVTLAGSAFFEKNDREVNNTFVGTGGLFQQDLMNTAVELRKRTAMGSTFAMRHLVNSDYNNNVGNRFGNPSGEFGALLESEIRQPLLQGSGAQFNRIAGPDGQPGAFNGVLLARVRTDVSLAEFEAGVRDLVANVENAYWDLYFSYRDLDAKKQARDLALETYQSVAAEGKYGRSKGNAENVGQALEQYWRFEAEVVNALNGRPIDGTRTDNGSSGGTARNAAGVHLAERRLRLIMGMPVNGGALLRTSDEPDLVPVSFDWSALVTDAINSRPELRRQKWRIKQRELELIASRNLLLPQLDVVGRYRWRGFGDDLVSQSNQPFASAYGDLAAGNYQEWQLGFEFEMPLGFRQAHTTVRNAEHSLARERVVFREQQRDIIFGLSNATSEVQRAFTSAQAQFNRFQAAQQQIEALKAAEKAGRTSVDLVLEAQRRVLDTTILYHQASVDYVIALRNVHYESGKLLDYNNIQLAEGQSPGKAYCDAVDLSSRRSKPLNYVCRSTLVAEGPAK